MRLRPAHRRTRTIVLHLMGVRTVADVCAAEMDNGDQCPAIVLGQNDAPEVNGGHVACSREVDLVPIAGRRVVPGLRVEFAGELDR